MVKTIISAIGTALRAVFVLARGALSIPGRLVGSLFGGGTAPPVEDTLEVQDLVAKLAEADAEEQDNWRKIADAIWRWCVDSLIADGPVAVPSMLPRSVREWLPGLTPQEAELLRLLVEGHHYKTAAVVMGISRHTVAFHARNVYAKLEVHSKSEAVARALRDRLV